MCQWLFFFNSACEVCWDPFSCRNNEQMYTLLMNSAYFLCGFLRFLFWRISCPIKTHYIIQHHKYYCQYKNSSYFLSPILKLNHFSCIVITNWFRFLHPLILSHQFDKSQMNLMCVKINDDNIQWKNLINRRRELRNKEFIHFKQVTVVYNRVMHSFIENGSTGLW